MSKKTFCAKPLLQWYDHHQRILPWRARKGEKPDPYYVLLSEIMLQQTQVKTVIPYFYRFIDRFPSLDRLAVASLDQVLALWTGLGYYSRARNLHQCAQEIMRQGGTIPQDIVALKRLSGIGNYTSAAVAAIGYNVPVVPVDGNIERITARLFAVEEPLPGVRKQLDKLAQTLNRDKIARQRASDFAQALFDVGATLCRPKNPSCLSCPLTEQCLAFQKGMVEVLPKRIGNMKKPVRYGISFFIQDSEGRILFRKRPMKGLLAGTLELPGTDWEDMPVSFQAVGNSLPYQGEWIKKGEITHVFTHFTLKITLYRFLRKLDLQLQRPEELWYSPETLEYHPFSSLMKKLVKLALD